MNSSQESTPLLTSSKCSEGTFQYHDSSQNEAKDDVSIKLPENEDYLS